MKNWRVGIALNTEVPIGQTATIMMTTIATGESDQVLQAAVEMNGNFSAVHAADTVRIQPKKIKKLWHQIRKVLSAHQLFDFGKVAISSNTQATWFKSRAADYYENGQEKSIFTFEKNHNPIGH